MTQQQAPAIQQQMPLLFRHDLNHTHISLAKLDDGNGETRNKVRCGGTLWHKKFDDVPYDGIYCK